MCSNPESLRGRLNMIDCKPVEIFALKIVPSVPKEPRASDICARKKAALLNNSRFSGCCPLSSEQLIGLCGLRRTTAFSTLHKQTSQSGNPICDSNDLTKALNRIQGTCHEEVRDTLEDATRGRYGSF